jgi:hypothetical protein
VLHGTVFDEVSPYGHVASRGTHLGGLRAARGGGVGCVTVASLLQLWPVMRRSASQSLASRMGQASRRSPLAPWRFNCSKRQQKHEFGGHLVFGVLFDLRLEIRARTSGIYRGFGIYS